jgi:hypothetical protein
VQSNSVNNKVFPNQYLWRAAGTDLFVFNADMALTKDFTGHIHAQASPPSDVPSSLEFVRQLRTGPAPPPSASPSQALSRLDLPTFGRPMLAIMDFLFGHNGDATSSIDPSCWRTRRRRGKVDR